MKHNDVKNLFCNTFIIFFKCLLLKLLFNEYNEKGAVLMGSLKELNTKLTIYMKCVDEKSLIKFKKGLFHVLELDFKNLDMDDTTLKDLIIAFLYDTLDIKKRINGLKPTEDLAFFLMHIGDIYLELMHMEKCLAFYRESLTIRTKILGVNHLDTAESYQRLAVVYEQNGIYQEALNHYLTALKIRKKFPYIRNNLLLAESYSRLSQLYYYMREYLMAKHYIDKSIEIKEKILVSNNKELLDSYYNRQCIVKECQVKQDCFSNFLETIHYFLDPLVRRLVR